MTILKKLRQISREANQKVEYINYGGCAVMAAIVAEELEKLGVKVEGIPSFGNPDTIRNKNKKTHTFNMCKWKDHGIGFNHVAIRFKYKLSTYTWDTDRLARSNKKFGIPECETSTRFGEGFTVKELKRLSKADGTWNSTFNRRDIPKLRKIVREAFKEEHAKLSNS